MITCFLLHSKVFLSMLFVVSLTQWLFLKLKFYRYELFTEWWYSLRKHIAPGRNELSHFLDYLNLNHTHQNPWRWYLQPRISLINNLSLSLCLISVRIKPLASRCNLLYLSTFSLCLSHKKFLFNQKIIIWLGLILSRSQILLSRSSVSQ